MIINEDGADESFLCPGAETKMLKCFPDVAQSLTPDERATVTHLIPLGRLPKLLT